MRIGMMADGYKPYVSGVTNYISVNKRALEQLGHEVFVFTFGKQTTIGDEANVIRSPGVSIKEKGLYVGISYTRKAKALLQTMDLVHVHHPFTSGRLAIRYCKPLAIPIVFTNHTRYDLYMQTYLPMLPEGLREAFLQVYLPAFCRSVDLVIAPSAGIEKVLRQQGVDVPIEIIPNGVDVQVFRSSFSPRSRSSLGFTDDDVVLVYAGRVAPEKNLAFLIHAFAGVAQTYDQARLLVVGDGPARVDLEQLAADLRISDKVVFTGLVPHEELPGYLVACNGFVTASVTEVHPLSVIEAMAVGLPVLGIYSPGVGDIIKDGITGLLSDDNPATFAVKMARLVNDPGLRRQLGQAALADSGEYAIEKTLQKILIQYQSLVIKASRKHHGIRFYLRSLWEKLQR
jgi:1,2-diacylglycerol 3-alpha-glucosyltransferase